MGFYASQCYGEWWIIVFNKNNCLGQGYANDLSGDGVLAKLLGLGVEEYKELLVQHGAVKTESQGIKFFDKNAVDEFVNYLNDKY